jgi:hypothetical protein
MPQHVPAPRSGVSDDQVVTLADLTAVHHAAASRLVFAMREEGASWRDVGREFGVAQQNAHKRWADMAAAPVCLEMSDGRARFVHTGSGLAWDARRETPLQAAHRDASVAAYLTQRVAVAMGVTA